MSEAKLVLSTRKDALTSVAKLARDVDLYRPEVLIGEGQGGIITLAYSKAWGLEVAMQARNLQLAEVHAAGEAWSGVKACIVQGARLGRAKLGLPLLEKCYWEKVLS